MTELTFLDAAQAARALRARELSATELVRAVLDRIAAVNPRVNAVREVLAEPALHAAAESDRRLAAGRPAGPLDGVPVTVKDNVDVAGSATTQGVAALAEAIATEDAPAVAHLCAAGAIPVARTNMPDFALRWHTDSGLLGPTVNPWDPTLTPGGSSGGEAVALATGMSLLGLGSDLGGSLRWPSQCAGIAALRPSLGRVPDLAATKPISLRLLDVPGPLARRVADLRLALGALAAPDPRDPWFCPAPPHADGPRAVHVLHEMDGVDIHACVQEALRRAAEALREHGYQVRDEPPPHLAEAAHTWGRLMAGGVRRVWSTMERVASAGGRRFMELMFELIPPDDLDGYAGLFETRARIAVAWAQYQRATPLVLAPIFAGRPFRAGADVDGVEAAADIVAKLRATLTVNVLGLPSVAVPVGLVDGLPQAVQVIGPRFAEEMCLRAGEAVEAGTPATPPAPVPA